MLAAIISNDPINDQFSFCFLKFQLTLVVHCLSRSPSTKKSQLDSNYSALTLKFGAVEPARHMTTFNQSQYIIPSSQNSSEINPNKDDRHIDEVGNFACRNEDLSPFMMDQTCHPYHSVVKFASPYEPINFSCSLQTTTTTLSRDNSLKCPSLKKCPNDKSADTFNGNRRTSFAERLKKCTQRVLIFKTDVNLSSAANEESQKIKKKVSSESLKSGYTISNSSLKEIDEEEFTSTELAQMMFEVNKEIRHFSANTS